VPAAAVSGICTTTGQNERVSPASSENGAMMDDQFRWHARNEGVMAAGNSVLRFWSTIRRPTHCPGTATVSLHTYSTSKPVGKCAS
jgi:hypothetical protein